MQKKTQERWKEQSVWVLKDNTEKEEPTKQNGESIGQSEEVSNN